MKYFQDYVSQNYLTLMLLFALAVVQLVNLKNKIKGAQLLWVLELIVLALTISNFVCIFGEKNLPERNEETVLVGNNLWSCGIGEL